MGKNQADRFRKERVNKTKIWVANKKRIQEVSSFSFPHWGKMRKARRGNDVEGKPVSVA